VGFDTTRPDLLQTRAQVQAAGGWTEEAILVFTSGSTLHPAGSPRM